jgi:hypothetical protein
MIFMVLNQSAEKRSTQALMKQNRPVTIGKILGKSQVSRLLAGAGTLEKLAAIVHELLPTPLKEHCRVLSVREETLVLAADSPVWAARLRYHSPELVKQLEHIRTVKLRTVQVRVRPVDKPPAAVRRLNKPSLSARNSVAMEQTARGVTDPGLKAALLRLARRKCDGSP